MMAYTSKLWRIEIVYLARGREKLTTREYRAVSIGAAQQIALLIPGAVRVQKIEEITEAQRGHVNQ